MREQLFKITGEIADETKPHHRYLTPIILPSGVVRYIGHDELDTLKGKSYFECLELFAEQNRLTVPPGTRQMMERDPEQLSPKGFAGHSDPCSAGAESLR